MNEKLLPCPFCGGAAEPCYDYYQGVSAKYHFIRCALDHAHIGGKACYNGAPGKAGSARMGHCDYCTLNQTPCVRARELWNTRQTLASIEGTGHDD